ncbi:MAG: hypothetical protein LIP08_04225, partial [Bacteroides sp.]|nr:hypothetical protein [Bacteroides sp.]
DKLLTFEIISFISVIYICISPGGFQTVTFSLHYLNHIHLLQFSLKARKALLCITPVKRSLAERLGAWIRPMSSTPKRVE